MNTFVIQLPCVKKEDFGYFVDGLHDYFLEASNYDPSVGIFGMREGETMLANALMESLEKYKETIFGG